jgi:hypothetical protein
MMHASRRGALGAPLTPRTSWSRGPLFTLGCLFFQLRCVSSQLCSGFSSRAGSYENRDRNVLLNSPRNTSGFLSYTAQVTDILTDY